MTESLNQGRATPKAFESVITPITMATAGAIVKIAAVIMVFLIFFRALYGLYQEKDGLSDHEQNDDAYDCEYNWAVYAEFHNNAFL